MVLGFFVGILVCNGGVCSADNKDQQASTLHTYAALRALLGLVCFIVLLFFFCYVISSVMTINSIIISVIISISIVQIIAMNTTIRSTIGSIFGFS